ncbi:hypothetical protein ACFWOJ_19100 [Streptomyces sp. NPDC058439]|uniref:hypothetical protein n=1 Tax=Streptomyces sp. NPDC058439 TaxID=3346500 RepID=UPI00365EFFD5
MIDLVGGISTRRDREHIGLKQREAWSGAGQGWQADGFYYYLGSSDPRANDRLVARAELGRPLHLFDMGGHVYRYIDEFTLNDVLPPVSVTSEHRADPVTVPVFKLRPTETVAHVPGQLAKLCSPSVVVSRPIERSDLLHSNGAERQALRPENELVLSFCEFLDRNGYPTRRLQRAVREHLAGSVIA